MVDQGGQVYMM